MSQKPDNPFDPFAAWRGPAMDMWSKTMIDFVKSDAYQQASGAILDNYLTASVPFQKALEQTMTQVLTGLNMPTRADITGLAERLTNIEIRLDDLEAKIDGMEKK